MKFLGKHIILELYDCPAALLKDPALMEKFMREAAEAAGATIVDSKFHHFSPHGVSGVVLIKESHLTIHTWPEHNYAAIDLFTCGDIKTEAAIAHLTEALAAGKAERRMIERGRLG